MNFKKFLALLLALAMILCVFAACSKDEDDDDDDDEKEEETVDLSGLGDLIGGIVNGDDSGSDTDKHETQPVPEPTYPVADYNNSEFTFLVIKHSNDMKDYYGGPYIDSDTLTGDRISDAVYQRNLAVEQKYNVKITERVEVGKNPNEALSTYFMSGDFCFDAIYGWGYKMGVCIPENYFADIASLPGVDLTKDYWSPSAVEDLMIADKLYIATNDISMNRLDWASMLYFNENVYYDFQVDRMYGDIYDLVRRGEWTLDKFLNMVKAVNRDLDGTSGISTADIFGLIDASANGADYLSALGVNLTTKTDDGFHELSFYGEKTVKIINAIQPVFSNKSYVKSYQEIFESAGDMSGYDDMYQYARSIFTTDHCLFISGALNFTSEAAFRNMESEYGVLPMPKYDKNQANYVSEVSSLASVFAIPSTVRNDVGSMERTGTILEYMAYKSNEIVTPAYYKEVLRGQRLDTDDAEMLDIIWSTTHYEFSKLYKEYDTPYEVAQAMFAKPQALASTYNARRTKLQKDLDDYFTKVIRLSA